MLDCILNKVNDGIAFEAGETTKAEVACNKDDDEAL